MNKSNNDLFHSSTEHLTVCVHSSDTNLAKHISPQPHTHTHRINIHTLYMNNQLIGKTTDDNVHWLILA